MILAFFRRVLHTGAHARMSDGRIHRLPVVGQDACQSSARMPPVSPELGFHDQ
jgi:hypothetical protein